MFHVYALFLCCHYYASVFYVTVISIVRFYSNCKYYQLLNTVHVSTVISIHEMIYSYYIVISNVENLSSTKILEPPENATVPQHIGKANENEKHKCHSTKEQDDMRDCYVSPHDNEEDIEDNSAGSTPGRASFHM